MEDFIKLVKNSSLIHPARKMDFDKMADGLFKEVESGNINVSYHPEFSHLAIFKYSADCVIEREWNEFTIMARGLILDLKNKVVIATPFIKFWNFDEIVGHEFFVEKDYVVTEKVDGCCHENVVLETEHGLMTIKKICETKYKGKVLSYDVYEDRMEFQNILGHSILEECDDWYELEIMSGQKIKLTGNHQVYLPELNCYRRVDQLEGTEKILLKK